MKDNQKKTTQKVFIAFSVLLCVLMCAFFVAFVGFELRADASSTDLVFSQDETQNAGDLTRDDAQIYLSYTSGNDGNDGSSSSLAIQTLDRAIALLPNGGIVNVLDAVQISTSTNVSPTNQIVLRRTEQSLSVSNGELVSISGSNTTVRFDNIVFDGASIDSEDIAKYLIEGNRPDPYMCLIDFDSYLDEYYKMDKIYKDKYLWNKMSLINIAKAGFFSSDRCIEEYSNNIWDLKSVKD